MSSTILGRREFLRLGGTALAGAVFAPRFCRWFREGAGELWLWGDGIHDDTQAIQIRLDRGSYVLPPNTYLVTGPLVFRQSGNVLMGSHFRMDAATPKPYLSFPAPVRETYIMNCTFTVCI